MKTRKPLRTQPNVSAGERLVHLLSNASKAQQEMTYIKLLNSLKEYAEVARAFDDSFGKLGKRKRGERGKLSGMIAFEELAVECLKTRKDRLKTLGVPTAEAWTQAAAEIGNACKLSPETLMDWYRGVRRRERGKPIETRTYRKHYAAKRQATKPD